MTAAYWKNQSHAGSVDLGSEDENELGLIPSCSFIQLTGEAVK